MSEQRPIPAVDVGGGEACAMTGLDRLPVLTVRQPWATAIIWAGKDVENRRAPRLRRGPLLIHAAAAHHPEYSEYRVVVDLAPAGVPLSWANTCSLARWALERQRLVPGSASALGVILGVVDVTGCHSHCDGSCSPWAQPGLVHWEFANPRPLPRAVPCRGKQGIWYLPDDVESAVRAQLEEK